MACPIILSIEDLNNALRHPKDILDRFKRTRATHMVVWVATSKGNSCMKQEKPGKL